MSDSQERVLTAQELSFYLKLPLSTVYALTKKGILRGVKFGKHWRYLEREVKEYLSRASHFPNSARPAIFDDRRKHPRINCALRARLIPVLYYGGDTEQTGAIRNLSAGGALFSTADASTDFSIGDPVKLVFDLPISERISKSSREVLDASASSASCATRPLEVNGRIVRLAGGKNTCGIKFKTLLPQDAEEIHQYVG